MLPVDVPNEHGWASLARRRLELAAVGLFILISLAIPLAITDLCPFSRAPMFADRPVRYCDYRIYDPEGNQLKALDFGLQRNYWGNPPGVGVGYRPPVSVDTFGLVAPRQAVEAEVSRRLANFPHLSHVLVVRAVIGAVDERRLGILQEERWRIDNPAVEGTRP
jgi:hypothetical protein